MQNLLQANIFFFISSLAVVVFTIGVIVITIYIVRILRDLKDITSTIQEESHKIISDIEILRENAKSQGQKLKNFAEPIFNFFRFKNKITKSKKKSNEQTFNDL